MGTLVDGNMQGFVAPAGPNGVTFIGMLGFVTSGFNTTTIYTYVNCPTFGGTYVNAISPSKSNCAVPIAAYTCEQPTIVNFSVWLSTNVGDQISLHSYNIMVADCLTSANLTKGCAVLTVPPKIRLLGNETQTIVMPIEVNCGIDNTTDFVLQLQLRTSRTFCGIYTTTHSCAIRSFNYSFVIPTNYNCNGPIGSMANFFLALFTPDDYAASIAPAPTGGSCFSDTADRWAGFRETYSFRVAGPLVSVGITPGAPALAAVGGVSVATPPSLLPSGLTGSLNLEIASGTSKNVVAAVDVLLSNGSEFKVQNLSVPLEVTFPLVPPTPCKDSMCHYWDTTHKTWSTDGCNTLQSAAGEWICSCTHATDFSILLLDSPSCAAELTPTQGPFYAYSIFYIILGLLALYPAVKVMALRNRHYGIVLEHLGVFAVCTIRTFLSMYQLGVSGPVTSIALSTIAAVPRFLEFTIFSFIIATWGALLHFSMGGTNPFKKARPYFIGINVVALIIVLYVFIAFGVSPSYEAAIVGEALLATNSMFLSVGFLVYATWLHRQFARAGGTSTSSISITKGCCTSHSRVVYLGWLLSFSFMAQAVFACLALSAVPRNGSLNVDTSEARYYIDLYNGLYRLFNLLTLGSILALYFDGVRKIVAKESSLSQQHSRISAHSSRTEI